MKITVVASACDLSEVAEYCELAARGHRVHVFYDPSWQENGAYEKSDVTTTPLPVSHRLDLRAAKALRAHLLKQTPELIYAPYNKTLAVSLMATRGMRVKVVGYRGTLGHLNHWDPASLMTYFHPRLDGIVCNCKAVQSYMRDKQAKAQLVTAYKGFDVDWYARGQPGNLADFGFPGDAFVVGFTGNVRPVKGIDILLKALAQLPEDSRIQLLLVGEIRDRRVRRMLNDPAFSSRVVSTGFRRDASRLTGACDAFVMPSVEREGVCRAVVEAMSQCVPPIVSDVGGMTELVQDGESGLVVPPSDYDALANALQRMERDVENCKQMGIAAQQCIRDHFSVARATDTMEEFFDRVARGEKR
jgi:glycosyltransferase involved in cell wall biosynthesis